MEEPEEKGLLTNGTSESTVTHDDQVGGETLECSVGCGGRVRIEGSFSQESVGEDGDCNGKDVMVEILGSDVYIDGVCTRGVGAELNAEVGCGGSAEGREDLSKDVKSAGLSSGAEARFPGSQALGSNEGGSVSELDNAALERESRGQKVVNTRCDNANALGCSLTVSSVGGENVQSVWTGKDEQQEWKMTDHGATGDENDVTFKTWDEQNSNALGLKNAADKVLLNSEETQCFRLEKCIEKKQGPNTSRFSTDSGQGMEVYKVLGGDFALDDSCSTKEVELNKNISDSEQGRSVDADAISMIIKEDTQVTDQGYCAPLDTEREKFHESNIRQNIEVQSSISEQVDSNGGQEIKVEEFVEVERRKTTDGSIIRHVSTRLGSLEIVYQARYFLPKEKEGEFSVSDMVWGKVRSHPWWPGQIFDPLDSSHKAMKHYKKDCYLVAYFGDRTFAWIEASQLKPFRTNFSSIEKMSNSESFQNAVDCALDEIARRVEFGLACSCIPKDTYDRIKCQTVENTGIRQDPSVRHGVDESLNARSFSPEKLMEYLKTLSELPTSGFDHLELVIAKAQLLSFYRFKGYTCLAELQNCGGLDDELDTTIHGGEETLSEVEHASPVSKNDGQAVPASLKSQSTSRKKRKLSLKDSLHPTKKERRLSELMSGTPHSSDGDYWSEGKVTDNVVSPVHGKKRRIMDHCADDSGMQDGRKTISLAKVSSTRKQSFKIGECIRRVASQLTGSPSVPKCSGDRSQKMDRSTDVFSGNGSDVLLQNFDETQRTNVIVPTEYSSVDGLLSSLKWVAQEPLGDYSFLNVILSFFSDFRNSVVVADDSGKDTLLTDKVGSKRKKPPIALLPETFEFEDMSDTYWTDRVIDNVSEEKPSQRNRNDYQIVFAEIEKPVQVSRRSNSRKRYFESNHAESPEKPSGYIDDNAPAELVMNFAELDSVPSETSLNKMFRHFGPLKESETEVDRVSSRARVVFKKCADAEVACSSAKKFNIFGPILVNYELNYTPSALFKASSVATVHDQEMHLDLSNFDVNML